MWHSTTDTCLVGNRINTAQSSQSTGKRLHTASFEIDDLDQTSSHSPTFASTTPKTKPNSESPTGGVS